MERCLGGADQSIRELTLQLIENGERCIEAGFPAQAEAILQQAWAIAEAATPDLGSDIAWGLAYLALQRDAPAEAAEWFGRVVTPPARSSALWPAGIHELRRLCTQHNTPAEHTNGSAAHPEAAPLQLHIHDLGSFEIRRCGVVLPRCKARKVIGIFRYLLTRRQHTAHKEELMEIFWPAASSRDSGHNLHVAVSTLRRYLDLEAPAQAASCLLFEAGEYRINPSVQLDHVASRFEQLSIHGEGLCGKSDYAGAEQALKQALALYQGDYHVDSEYSAWAVAERDRLLVRYLAALAALGQTYVAQRNYEGAIECYAILLARDNYREDVHRALMRCYWELGRRAEALQQYDRCTAILAHDLNLEPMEETRELYQRFTAGAD